MYIKGTNGAEYVADEVASILGDELQPGEWHRIGTEITLDVNNGIAVEVAKNWATRRALERRGFNIFESAPRAGSRTSAESVPHVSHARLESTPDQVLNAPIEQWSNFDVGVAFREVMRLGETHPDAIKLATKIRDWYTSPLEKQFEVKPFGDDQTDIYADGAISLSNISVTQDYVLSSYEKQGFSAEEAAKHLSQQVSEGGFGLSAAQFGLTVRESQAISDAANNIDIRNRGFTGQEMIAAERYRTEYQKTGRKDIAMEKARAGLAEARTYNGPSEDISFEDEMPVDELRAQLERNTTLRDQLTETFNGPSQDRRPRDNLYDPKDITAYIDTFRDEVELSRVRGDHRISGVPEGAVVSAGSQNSVSLSQERRQEDHMTPEQNQRQLEAKTAVREAKAQAQAAQAAPKTPKTITINVPRQDYVSGQALQGAARAANHNIDTTGLNVDLLDKPATKTLPGQYEVTLGGWPAVSGARAPKTPAQKQTPTPKNGPDLMAVDKRSDQQRAQATKTAAQGDGLLSETSKPTRASAKEDTLDDAEFGVDKAPNAEVVKVDKLGESVNVHDVESLEENAISKAQEERERQNRGARQGRERSGKVSNDNAAYGGAGSQAGRDAASQISMGETSGRSTGYNDRQDLATALSKSGQHGDVGVSNLTDYGTIRGSQQTNMLAEQNKGLFDDNDSGSGSSSRVICTELVRQGLMAPSLQRLDIAYTLRHLSPATVRGYHAWAVPYVRLMKRSGLATRVVEPLARWRAEEIAFRMKSRSRPHYRGRVVRWLGEPVCWALGTMLGWVGDPDRFYPQPDRN